MTHQLRTISPLAVLAMLAIGTGCGPAGQTEGPTEPRQGPSLAKAGGLPVVRLTVTVADAPNRITSDLRGPYVDGQQGVTANLDQVGNLTFSVTGIQADPTKRRLVFDYSVKLTGTSLTLTQDQSRMNSFTIRTIGNAICTGTNPCGIGIQALAPGQTACYSLPTAWSDTITQYQGVFNTAANGSTAYAAVTRTDNGTGKRSWSVTSADCNGNPGRDHVAAVTTVYLPSGKVPPGYGFVGLYSMPIAMTLTEN